MRKLIINPSASFKKKGDCCAVYFDFNYFFLWGEALGLMEGLLETAKEGKDIASSQVTESFIKFLIARKILLEV